MPPRLTFALALSLALHGGLLLPGISKRPAPPPPALQAQLRLPPEPEAAVEPLLKNTLDQEPQVAKPLPSPPPSTQHPAALKNTQRRDVQVAQKKLSKTQFYPSQAVEQGIEGEVRLILKLSSDGAVDDVGIAASSGHAILDNAAVKAAYAMGTLTGVSARELILPVIFRLQ